MQYPATMRNLIGTRAMGITKENHMRFKWRFSVHCALFRYLLMIQNQRLRYCIWGTFLGKLNKLLC